VKNILYWELCIQTTWPWL